MAVKKLDEYWRWEVIYFVYDIGGFISTAERARLANLVQGSSLWLTARFRFITGSKIATVCNINPFEKPSAVYDDIITYGKSSAAKQITPAMQLGTQQETRGLRNYFAWLKEVQHVAIKVTKPGLVVHPQPDKTYLAYSPDSLLTVTNTNTAFLIEMKTTAKPLPTEVYSNWYAQVQLGMEVCNLDRTDLVSQHITAVHHNFGGFRIFRINRDRTYFAALDQRVQYFLTQVSIWVLVFLFWCCFQWNCNLL